MSGEGYNAETFLVIMDVRASIIYVYIYSWITLVYKEIKNLGYNKYLSVNM